MKIQIYLVPVQPAPIKPAPVQPTPAPASKSTAKSNPGTCSAPLPYVLYHYTTQEKLAQILSTDVIKPSTTMLAPEPRHVSKAPKSLLRGQVGQTASSVVRRQTSGGP